MAMDHGDDESRTSSSNASSSPKTNNGKVPRERSAQSTVASSQDGDSIFSKDNSKQASEMTPRMHIGNNSRTRLNNNNNRKSQQQRRNEEKDGFIKGKYSPTRRTLGLELVASPDLLRDNDGRNINTHKKEGEEDVFTNAHGRCSPVSNNANDTKDTPDAKDEADDIFDDDDDDYSAMETVAGTIASAKSFRSTRSSKSMKSSEGEEVNPDTLYNYIPHDADDMSDSQPSDEGRDVLDQVQPYKLQRSQQQAASRTPCLKQSSFAQSLPSPATIRDRRATRPKSQRPVYDTTLSSSKTKSASAATTIYPNNSFTHNYFCAPVVSFSENDETFPIDNKGGVDTNTSSPQTMIKKGGAHDKSPTGVADFFSEDFPSKDFDGVTSAQDSVQFSPEKEVNAEEFALQAAMFRSSNDKTVKKGRLKSLLAIIPKTRRKTNPEFTDKPTPKAAPKSQVDKKQFFLFGRRKSPKKKAEIPGVVDDALVHVVVDDALVEANRSADAVSLAREVEQQPSSSVAPVALVLDEHSAAASVNKRDSLSLSVSKRVASSSWINDRVQSAVSVKYRAFSSLTESSPIALPPSPLTLSPAQGGSVNEDDAETKSEIPAVGRTFSDEGVLSGVDKDTSSVGLENADDVEVEWVVNDTECQLNLIQQSGLHTTSSKVIHQVALDTSDDVEDEGLDASDVVEVEGEDDISWPSDNEEETPLLKVVVDGEDEQVSASSMMYQLLQYEASNEFKTGDTESEPKTVFKARSSGQAKSLPLDFEDTPMRARSVRSHHTTTNAPPMSDFEKFVAARDSEEGVTPMFDQDERDVLDSNGMHSLKDFANDIEEDFSNKQCMQFGPREEVIADMVDAFQCGGSGIIDLVGEAITPKDDYSEFSDSSEESEDEDSYYRRRSANRRRQRRRTPQGTRPRNSRRGHKNSRARSCSPNTLQEKRSRRKSLQERRSRRKSTRARNYRGEIAATP